MGSMLLIGVAGVIVLGAAVFLIYWWFGSNRDE